MVLMKRFFQLGACAAGAKVSAPTWNMAPKKRALTDDGRLLYSSDHNAIFGTGHHVDVYWKAKIIQLHEGVEQFLEHRKAKRPLPTLDVAFHQITGFWAQQLPKFKNDKQYLK